MSCCCCCCCCCCCLLLALFLMSLSLFLQVIEEKPVLICEVEYIKDDEDPTANTEEVRAGCRAGQTEAASSHPRHAGQQGCYSRWAAGAAAYASLPRAAGFHP